MRPGTHASLTSLLGLAGLLALAAPRPAAADATAPLLGPREIAVGEAMRGGAVGASAIGLNPAGLPLNHELVFEAAYGRRATDGASVTGVSACDSTSALPGCFFYAYAGESPEVAGATRHRHAHLAGMSLSRVLTPRLFLGATLKYFRTGTDVMGEVAARGFNWDAGATAVLTPIFTVGVAGYNLWGDQAAELPRAVGGGFQARPIPMLTVSFDSRWRLDGDSSARYGGGAELFLRGGDNQSGYALRAGGLHEGATGGTFVSGGLGLASMKFGLDVTARRQVRAGDETLVIASLRFFGPRVDANATSFDQ